MFDYAVVAVLGGIVGLGELASRYRDAPERALSRSAAAWSYCAINALASVAALHLLAVFNVTFGQTNATALRWLRILAAGVSAMALFRTSLFTVRIGNQDVGIGPVAFLQVILDAVDRAVDRRRARGRAAEVQALMAGLSFDKALIALPAYCLALMQNLSREDQTKLAESLVTLKNTDAPETVKLRILAVHLLNALGPTALEAAIKSLGDELRTSPAPKPGTPPQP